jgi:hypothetical protein
VRGAHRRARQAAPPLRDAIAAAQQRLDDLLADPNLIRWQLACS